MKKYNINFIKSVGIIFVVIGHFANPFSSFIYSWHMPLFFIISGYLTNINIPFLEFFKKQFQRLMYPFFIWEIISLITLFLKNIYLNRPQPNFEILTIKSILWMNYDILNGQYGFVLWFLPSLFIGRILMYALFNIFKNKLVIFLVASVLFLLSFQFTGIFNSDIGLNICFWMILGRLYYNIKFSKNILNIILSFIILYFIYFIFKIPQLDIANKIYSNYLFINIIWASIIISLIFKLSTLEFNNLKIYKYLSLHTFSIFVLHPYTNNIANYTLKNIFSINILWLPETIFSLFLILILIKIFEKLMLNKILCLT